MSQTSESNAVRPSTLHHVNLKTRRLQEMIDWYATVLGMKPNHQFEGGAFLTNDEANHRLALLTSPQLQEDPDKLTRTGMHHSAYEYGNIDDLLDTYIRLKGQGILPHACLDHGMTTSFYYEDPDGNSVELQVDNFGNWEQSAHWMRTSPQFTDDPIGKAIDPDQLVAARKAGASLEELHRRGYAGDFVPSEPWDLHVPLGDPRSPV